MDVHSTRLLPHVQVQPHRLQDDWVDGRVQDRIGLLVVAGDLDDLLYAVGVLLDEEPIADQPGQAGLQSIGLGLRLGHLLYGGDVDGVSTGGLGP